MRVVVAPCGVEQAARGHKASHRQAAFPDNQLAGIRVHLVGVLVEVALHAVNLHRLRDVSGNHPVVVALFRQVLVIVESGLVGEEQRAFDVDFPFVDDDFGYELLLSFGNKCECLEPVEVREKMIEMIKNMIKIYN